MLVGAVAAYYKYGDRTDIADKHLKGTREAVNGLKAYLGRALAEAVRPTVERIGANFSPDTVAEELRGESFQNDVSEFVERDIDEMISYGKLVHARDRWSFWARKQSWGIIGLSAIQAVATFYFAVLVKGFGWDASTTRVALSFVISGLGVGFCVFCHVVMLHHHDQICKYRDKIL